MILAGKEGTWRLSTTRQCANQLSKAKVQRRKGYLVEGLASVVMRFFHSAGSVDLSCGNSSAAITSCLTLRIVTNSNAALGLAASSSLASLASRHSELGTIPAVR